jgi:diguanylate cyclase (GGDEF)-like protein
MLIADQKLVELLLPIRHPADVSQSRYATMISRAQSIAGLLSIPTIGWTLIDAVTLDWPVWCLLASCRVSLFLGLLGLARHSFHSPSGVAAYACVGMLFALCAAFLVGSNTLFWLFHPEHASLFAATMYFYAPFLMAAGLGIFPLAAIEAAVLTIAILLTMVISICLRPEQVGEVSAAATLARLLLIAAIGGSAAMSQLRFLMELTERSSRDALTGAFTRRVGEQLLTLQFAQAERSDAPLAVLFIDIDRFKDVNDVFGHEAGDILLSHVASSIRNSLRRQDVLIRWGGEEFVVVLPETDLAGARALLGRLGQLGLALSPSGLAQTASIGIAERKCDRAANCSAMVELADQRMYAAKRNGRNQYVAPDGTHGRFVTGSIVSASVATVRYSRGVGDAVHSEAYG